MSGNKIMLETKERKFPHQEYLDDIAALKNEIAKNNKFHQNKLLIFKGRTKRLEQELLMMTAENQRLQKTLNDIEQVNEEKEIIKDAESGFPWRLHTEAVSG